MFIKGDVCSKYIIDRKYIFYCYIPLVLLSKIIRYTIMKTVLVDVGIGHSWVTSIANRTYMLNQGISLNIVSFYSFINVFSLDTYVGLEVYVTVLWNILFIILLFRLDKKLFVEDMIFVCMSIGVLNIFCFTIAKEPIQMLYFLLLYGVLKLKISYIGKVVGSIVVLLLITTTYRKYYIIILFFFLLTVVFFWIFFKIKQSVQVKHMLFFLLLVGIVYYIFLQMAQLVFPAEYTELIRVRLRTSDATSDMRVLLSGSRSNQIIFCIDYVIMIVRMLFPLELARLGMKYIPYVVFQIFITCYMYGALKKLNEMNVNRNLAVMLYLGFLFGSATFEPDFGSWVRHEAVIFPLFLFLIKGRCDYKNTKKSKEVFKSVTDKSVKL